MPEIIPNDQRPLIERLMIERPPIERLMIERSMKNHHLSIVNRQIVNPFTCWSATRSACYGYSCDTNQALFQYPVHAILLLEEAGT